MLLVEGGIFMSEYTGRTVEEAIQKGLSILGLSREMVEIKTVEENKKGFLGIGRKEAIVEITPITKIEKAAVKMKDELFTNEEVTDFETVTRFKVLENLSEAESLTELALYLTEIAEKMGAPAKVKIERESGHIILQIDSTKSGLLIGKHGRVLNALQYISQVFIHRVANQHISVIVNVGDYRTRRQEAMERLATRTARKVEETGKPVFLEPMPSFERKIIHGILTDHPYVETHSEGTEPHRYLVVEPKKNLF